MSKPSLVIVLCEDQHQRDLVRHYLKKAGISRVRFNPEGKCGGSGEQHVRLNYSNEVGACRQRLLSKRAVTALIVVIDADKTTVEVRREQLASAIAESRQDTLKSGEPVAHLIPKRNVETWILCLNGSLVDEEKDYKTNGDWGGQVKLAAEELFRWSRPNADALAHCVESLRRGIVELRRVQL